MFSLAPEAGGLREWIHLVVFAMEAFAILVIVVGIVYGAAQFALMLLRDRERKAAYHAFKAFVAHALLLGLEILVAADVVYTVTLEPTLDSVIVLGILVLIRTFLGWSLVVEMEGRWPWQPVQVVTTGAGQAADASVMDTH